MRFGPEREDVQTKPSHLVKADEENGSLEYSYFRASVRAAPNALTLFHAAGGGLVDVATATGASLVHEIIPLVGTTPLERAKLELFSATNEAVVSIQSENPKPL